MAKSASPSGVPKAERGTKAKTAKVSDFMAKGPITIDAANSLAAAHRLMRQKRIRHLPVLKGRRLVGIVSMGDLHLLETLKDIDPETVPIEDAMTRRPYRVGPDEPLTQVAAAMARKKLGSAIVVDKGAVVGIFTTIDALRLLAERM